MYRLENYEIGQSQGTRKVICNECHHDHTALFVWYHVILYFLDIETNESRQVKFERLEIDGVLQRDHFRSQRRLDQLCYLMQTDTDPINRTYRLDRWLKSRIGMTLNKQLVDAIDVK